MNFETFITLCENSSELLEPSTRNPHISLFELFDNLVVRPERKIGVLSDKPKDLLIENLEPEYSYKNFQEELRYADVVIWNHNPLPGIILEEGGFLGIITHDHGLTASCLCVVEGTAQIKQISKEKILKILRPRCISYAQKNPLKIDETSSLFEVAGELGKLVYDLHSLSINALSLCFPTHKEHFEHVSQQANFFSHTFHKRVMDLEDSAP